MSAELVPVTEFDPQKLGPNITDLVRVSEDELIRRHFYGVLRRYYSGSGDKSARNIRKAQLKHQVGELSAFAIVDEDKAIRGMASIYPGLFLFRQKLPIPPAVSKRYNLSSHADIYDPNISAWTDDVGKSLLKMAYSGLVFIAENQKSKEHHGLTWTIEPQKSSENVHDSILRAGLVEVGTGWYDDQETNYFIPPRSVLYAQTILPLDTK